MSFLSSKICNVQTLICVGEGGAGKTTVAASIALNQANAGKRVACITIDPAKRLADALGVDLDKNDGSLKDISDLLCEYSKGSLEIGMLDAKSAFDKMVVEKSANTKSAQKLLNNTLYKYVSSSLQGMQEYMALEKLSTLINENNYDLIVLDTPPIDNCLNFFKAPAKIKTALNGPLVKMMQKAYLSKNSRFNFVGKWSFSLFNTLSAITGAQLFVEIIDFVDALSHLFKSFIEEASHMDLILRSNDIKVIIISSLERNASREIFSLENSVKALGYHVDGIVFNRCTYPGIESEIPKELCENMSDEIGEIISEWNLKYKIENEIIESIKEHFSSGFIIGMVPFLNLLDNKIEFLKKIGANLKEI
ncbi:MAG: ArsA family ATPase [Deltaproteobacteria bacterium]|nr:ArsA family ATPase [Deltaproteobacteria bacterium]